MSPQQEQNWLNLFGQYTPEGTTWHALTTVYALDLQVIRAYQFTRRFSINPERTIVYHQNTYYLPDGQTKEQSWEIEKEKCNQADGVFHPESEYMRAIGFSHGTSIWVSQHFKPKGNFGSEVFVKQQDWRYGIIPVYQDGNLDRLVLIKEHPERFPEQLDEQKIHSGSGTWQLKHIKMTPDLQESTDELVQIDLDIYATKAGHSIYTLPEQIILNLPIAISVGEGFDILVGKEISENKYMQMRSSYDATGKFSGLISSEFAKLHP